MREWIVGWVAVIAAAGALLSGCAGGLRPLEGNAPPMRVVVFAPGALAGSPAREETLAREMAAAAVLSPRADAGQSGVVWQWRLAVRDEAGAVTYPVALAPSPAPVASFDAGPAHFCFLDNDADIREGAPAAVALIDDLSLNRKAWKFLFLDHPIAAERIGPDFDYIGRLVEREKVLLVVAPGAGGYVRSRPIGAAAEGAVRYIALPSDPAKSDAMRPWLACAVAGGDYAIFEFTSRSVSWRLFDRDGKLLDILEIPAHNRAGTASGVMTYGELFAAVNAVETATPPLAPGK